MEKISSNKKIAVSVFVVAVLGSVLFYRFVRNWQVSEKLETVISSQLDKIESNNSNNLNYTIVIPNSWHAENIIICRSYLEYSKSLESNIFNTGISESAALKIANSPRWTEGTHIYLVRKDKVLYCYCDKLHLKDKDFVANNIGDQIYLDIVFTPWQNIVEIDPNATSLSVAKIFLVKEVR